jgi:hypothetical protein
MSRDLEVALIELVQVLTRLATLAATQIEIDVKRTPR